MEIIAKDVVSILIREMVDGRVAYIRRPLPGFEADSAFMDIFSNEADSMSQLSVSSVLRYDQWVDGGWVMKVAPGFISLYDALTKRPALLCSPQSVCTITRAIAEHLDYLHRNGLWMVQLSVHNILVNTSTMQVKMLAPLSLYMNLHRNIFAGQAGMAPETENPKDICAATDFYGLAHVLSKFGQFSPLPRSLNIIVSECSKQDPEQRIANTTELLNVLDHADEGRKILPYVIGAAGFAVLLAMFLFVGGDEELPNPDMRYIKGEDPKPSPEGLPDTSTFITDHFMQLVRADSLLADSLRRAGYDDVDFYGEDVYE